MVWLGSEKFESSIRLTDEAAIESTGSLDQAGQRKPISPGTGAVRENGTTSAVVPWRHTGRCIRESEAPF